MTLLLDNPAIRLTVEKLVEFPTLGLLNFHARPDNPELGDQQNGYLKDRNKVSFFQKGNASGGTTASAMKLAEFVLRGQPPPRHDTPFWIISEDYDLCVDTCWKEKLYGQGFIPECEIDRPRIEWLSRAGDRPSRVPLKPWPGRRGKNWVLEFKSYGQRRQAMQAASIGGFWFCEQFPWDIFTEVLRGCRDYMFPGGQFCEFTPIDPGLCKRMQEIIDHPREGWKVYRGNTYCNQANLAEGFVDDFKASIADELLQTRLRGDLAGFAGTIYQSFNPSIHVVEDEHDERISFRFDDDGITHGRGIDWGESEHHWFAAIFGCRSLEQDWLIYDEYCSNAQDKITSDHAREVVARSMTWGYPVPNAVGQPAKQATWFSQGVLARLKEIDAVAWQKVMIYLAALAVFRGGRQPPINAQQKHNQHFGTMDYADSARPGEIREFVRYGVPVGFANKNVEEGINCVRELLKINPFTNRPRLFICRRCERFIRGLRQYRRSDAAAPRATKPVPLKLDDDEVDAGRYLIMSASRRSGNALPSLVDASGIRGQRKSIQYQRAKSTSDGWEVR